MFGAWARAYAERWGLPHAAVSELVSVLEAASRGRQLPAPTAPRSDPPTEPPSLSDARTGGWDVHERYEDMGIIGEGGMGEVLRKWDNALNRAVAMKILRKDLCDREDLVMRFIEEAQATAQLEHPGIVPVYGYGRLPDGRPYFTMKEIRGRSLLEVIEELHAASDGTWGTTPSGWTLNRLITVFQQVCEAVAYAHSRGVLHRDLKPTNVMVGAFGEVVVMDWGLAKIAGSVSGPISSNSAIQVVTSRSRGNMFQTRSGSVAGTPNYMPPEQARGDHGRIGPWSDVYSLGALLYEILADRAPYDGDNLDEVVAKVLAGPPPPPTPRWHSRRDSGPHNTFASAEESLRQICAKAMARDLADRYMDAGTLAEEISAWLETAGQREAANRFVRRAEQLEPEISTLRTRLVQVRAEAERRMAELPREAPLEEKRLAWALEDQAAEIDRELGKTQSRYTELLQAALAASPGLPEAQVRLESLRDPLHSEPEPGYGSISLRTDPPAATVVVHRIDVVDRRLVAVQANDAPTGPLRTPLDTIPFPAGTWQLDLFAPGYAPLRVLARVVGGQRWSTGPTPAGKMVVLAPLGDDPPETVRIPGGWFLCGGDREAADSLPQSRAWVAPFLVSRFPITCAQWLAFLQEDPAAALFAPPGFSRGPSGRWRLPVGWEPEQPVRRVTFEGAQAYAAWVASRTGKPWRLPRELEWEKAARGVDGRLFPWGNYIDPTFCCLAESHGGEPPRPASIHDFPLDTSPYEVRGMGGNVRDWVIDERSPKRAQVAPEHRLVKGGHFLGVAQFARSALRYAMPLPEDETVGFRLACPID
jgi:serine/threonine protein kinase/formylglycine-generating enzyme required for sulfatase activity